MTGPLPDTPVSQNQALAKRFAIFDFLSRTIRDALPSLQEHGDEARPAADWRTLFSLFCMSIILILLSWQLIPESIVPATSSDFAHGYLPAAMRWIDGKGYVDNSGSFFTAKPPGYPMVVAFAVALSRFMDQPLQRVIMGLNLVFAGLATVVLFQFAQHIWSLRWSLLVALAWIVFPFHLWLTRLPLSELPFLPLFFAAVYLGWRAMYHTGSYVWPAFGSGVLAGMAMLVRPIALGLGVVLAALLYFMTPSAPAARRRRLAWMLLAGNLLVVLPWEMIAYQHTGRVVMLSDGGILSLRDGLTFGTNLKGFRQGTWVPEDVREVMANLTAKYPQLQSYSTIAAAVLNEFEERPVAVIKLFLLKVIRSWYGTDSQRHEGLALMLQTVYLLPVIVGSVAAMRKGGRYRRAALFIWAIAGYFWIMNVCSTTLVRYMVPVTGLLCILIPAGLEGRRRLLTAREAP